MTSGSWESGYRRRRDEQSPCQRRTAATAAASDDDDDDDDDDSHTSRDAVGSSQAWHVDDTAADKKPSIIQFNYCNGHSVNWSSASSRTHALALASPDTEHRKMMLHSISIGLQQLCLKGRLMHIEYDTNTLQNSLNVDVQQNSSYSGIQW